MKQVRHDSLALLLPRLLHLSSERTISCAMAALEHPFARMDSHPRSLGRPGSPTVQDNLSCKTLPCINNIQYSIQSFISIAISACVERPDILLLFSELSYVVRRYKVLSISIYYRFPLCPFCAANIFGQRERRRDQSHVWSQDILESLASESSFHHHLSHTASVHIVIDIPCPRSGQMCRMACRRLEFCIRNSRRSGRIERLIWPLPLSFVPEILLEPAAARHQHRNCTSYIMIAIAWLLQWFCHFSIQDCKQRIKL